ncbi:hypothetical protein MMC27_006173 [Xylographa pallens]|nr:hypothetical protein [Xylographa pallens]
MRASPILRHQMNTENNSIRNSQLLTKVNHIDTATDVHRDILVYVKRRGEGPRDSFGAAENNPKASSSTHWSWISVHDLVMNPVAVNSIEKQAVGLQSPRAIAHDSRA